MYYQFKQAQAVVLGAGEWPSHPLATTWLDAGLPVVCCDGAAENMLRSGRTPWRIVGDCDSLSPALQQQYSDILRHIPDQETNDQTKAVKYLHARGFDRVVIVGATGLREDHALGNIALLQDYMEMGVEARIYTDHGVFIPAQDSLAFGCRPGTRVSVFNFGARRLCGEGLQYQLYDFTRIWQGTLNVAAADRVSITADGPFMVFVKYP